MFFSLYVHPWAYKMQEHPPSPRTADTGPFDLIISKSELSQWIVCCEEKNISLTHSIILGPFGDLMLWSKERERSTSLRSLSSCRSRQNYSDGGIQAGSGFCPRPHYCLRPGHLPNSCEKSHVLYYFPCLFGSIRSTHQHHRAQSREELTELPGWAALP